MPLRAVLGERDVIASDLDAPAWEALKTRRDDLRMPCCSVRAVMGISKLGLRHFAHYTRDLDGVVCDWKPESEDHLRAKTEIIPAVVPPGGAYNPKRVRRMVRGARTCSRGATATRRRAYRV